MWDLQHIVVQHQLSHRLKPTDIFQLKFVSFDQYFRHINLKGIFYATLSRTVQQTLCIFQWIPEFVILCNTMFDSKNARVKSMANLLALEFSAGVCKVVRRDWVLVPLVFRLKFPICFAVWRCWVTWLDCFAFTFSSHTKQNKTEPSCQKISVWSLHIRAKNNSLGSFDFGIIYKNSPNGLKTTNLFNVLSSNDNCQSISNTFSLSELFNHILYSAFHNFVFACIYMIYCIVNICSFKVNYDVELCWALSARKFTNRRFARIHPKNQNQMWANMYDKVELIEIFIYIKNAQNI